MGAGYPSRSQQVAAWLGLLGAVLVAVGLVVRLAYRTLVTSSVVLLIVGLVLLLIALLVNFARLRGWLGSRSTRYGFAATLMILVVLGIAVMVEVLSTKHTKRFDVTKTARYTLAPQTQQVVRNLKQTVEVIAFYEEAQGGRLEMQNLLDRYAYLSEKFSFRFVDPDRSPREAEKFGIKSYGTVVLKAGKKEEKLVAPREQDLTNGLIKVLREKNKTAYLLKGHGEKSSDNSAQDGYSQIAATIRGSNYDLKDLVLLTAEKVPDDATTVIIAGPRRELHEKELERLTAFIAKGGNALFLLDPDTPPGYAKLLDKYGVVLGNDIVLDKLSRLFGVDEVVPTVSSYEKHPITDRFNVVTFFPLATSVRPKEKPGLGITVQTLAKTSPNSWGETDRAKLDQGEAVFDQGKDIAGPVSVAVVATVDVNQGQASPSPTAQPEPKQARLVVFGDSDFASNNAVKLQGNSDLFMNTLSWLAQDEDLIAIRPKDIEGSPVLLSGAEPQAIFWLSVVLLPVIVLGFGVYKQVQRKRRG
ncbi:MAG: GldG family protein [Candidatus Tectomicrobia bacterium]|nr:GldG family protein [Candidatus Tectomicrobia bacterium]